MDMSLYDNIKTVLDTAKAKAYSAVNFAMVEAYWNIGRLIVEKQDGENRAEYGKQLISYLSERLTADFGKGFTTTNLKYMRQFYLQFQLDRQINSFFYERLLSSRSADAKEKLSAEVERKEPGITPLDVIKDPYVLEFLGLNHNNYHFESDIEKAMITHIQKFLLELGRGFTFEARQKHISFDGEHFYIDLVFYNYILKCFVLVDLKTGRLTHQDLWQMQMYVNYYTHELMNEGDNPPIGIVLCAAKSESVVKYTLSEKNMQIFTSKYKLYLPTEEELKREIEQEQKLISTENLLLKDSTDEID